MKDAEHTEKDEGGDPPQRDRTIMTHRADGEHSGAEEERRNSDAEETEASGRPQHSKEGKAGDAPSSNAVSWSSPSFSYESWLQGADAYLLEDESKHLRQRELNKIFKKKLSEYNATRPRRESPDPQESSHVPTDGRDRAAEAGRGEGGADSDAGAKRAEAARAPAPVREALKEDFLAFAEFKRNAQKPEPRKAAAEVASDPPWFSPAVAAAATADTWEPRERGGDLRGEPLRRCGTRRDKTTFPERGQGASASPPSFHVSLHKEICDLLAYIQPTDVEEYKTLKAIARLQFAASLSFPGCSCKCFGSFATSMMLPGGDVDICILIPSSSSLPSSASSSSSSSCAVLGSTWTPASRGENHPASVNRKRRREEGNSALLASLSPEAALHHSESVAQLTLLSATLLDLKVAQALELVSSARVPIVKYIDAETGVPVDVSVNQPSSLETTAFAREMLVKFPLLRPLLLLVKFFLKLRNLSETYRGGAGSYLLFTMGLLFLKSWPAAHDPTLQRGLLLSHLLIDFFHFWGRHWNYRDWGGCVRGLGHTFLKDARPELWGERRELLCMESPTTPDIDLGKNAFNISNVRAAFHQAFADLMALQVEWVEAEAQWRAARESRRKDGDIDVPLPRMFSESLLAHLFDPAHAVFSLREPRRVQVPREETVRSLLGLGRARLARRERGRHERLNEEKQQQRTGAEKEKGGKAENEMAWVEPDIPLEMMEEVAATFLLASSALQVESEEPRNAQVKRERAGTGGAAENAEKAVEDTESRRAPGSALSAAAPRAEEGRRSRSSEEDFDDPEVAQVFAAFHENVTESHVKKKLQGGYAAFLARLSVLAS
ncbi:polynucleotide adenylyltransferase [Toxoplasma gondii GAB2-2007-GAL-DOM2]|uniref:Polynucleotide adenylyltransferase n=5 Tax=Toxoplasma gondii TaxID=5811 RepID=S7W3U9_TOXGG|nr:polynucleotide adenylyltransferase [Toxoplasma gondii GT1]KAF4644639.1 polynucleotide adenylyltransferase [Toxoplasma gondii]KFG29652.1 polynucleotide adenylyltransferase [Toxoplasma gondii GAB2-2007-GAL-DOM2]KFG33231.1 polynucleotide adenylyltransferase [Toxoplasma gondii FOU]RQX73522.1 polynucleotide adenylyltransferase [Toxoplasma gondii CAST]